MTWQQLYREGCAALAAARFPDAVRSFRDALASNREVPEIWNDLGIALFQAGERREALLSFQRAVTIAPGFVQAHNNLGRFLAGCGDLEQGLAACHRAIELDPACAEAYDNAGTILMALLRHDEALACFNRACEIAPSLVTAWINRAHACRELLDFRSAETAYGKALQLCPGHAQAVAGLAALLRQRGDNEAAVSFLREAVAAAPHDPDIHSNLLMTMNYSSRCSQEELADEARLWGVLHATEGEGEAPERDHATARRLRVGYISADLHRHPVGFFLKQVLKNHDRNSFEIILFHNGTFCDEVTQELARGADRWCVIAGLSDAEALQLIREHGIDILVDLSGHTPGNRLSLFSRRAARVQASWIGYSHSTGVPAMDYLITDAVTVPPGEERYYSERLIRLPQGRFCYAPPAPSPFVDQLPALENGCVTFGSFNNVAKLTPEVIALWAKVLLAVPNSRLVLKWSSLGRASVRRSFRARFARHGVTSDRIELRGASSHFLALAEYNDVDIALDPFPFNGGLTSCEALWMGVPVLTLRGNTPIGRQTASFLTALHLPELICEDGEEYVRRAVALAGDLERLAALREGLRDRIAASPLCDGAGFARSLEQAYRNMFEEQGTAAQQSGFSLPRALPEAPLEPRFEALPRQRLRIAYLVGDNPPAAILDVAALHDPAQLELFLYRQGKARPALPEAWRQRVVAGLDEQLFLRLLRRERIDVLVDLREEPIRVSDALKASLPVLLTLSDVQVAACAAAVPEHPVSPATVVERTLALEELYRERWLSWFVAQNKPRQGRKGADSSQGLEQGRALRKAGRLEEANGMLAAALLKHPADTELLTELGIVLVYQWRLAEGLACFRRALVGDPGHVKARSSLLFAMNYSDRLAAGDIYAESRKFERMQRRRASATASPGNLPDPDRPLRIGYLSADLYRHSVSFFFEPLLMNHERSRFETVCYNCTPFADETTARLRGMASQWRECCDLDDAELASVVRDDGIDILVELGGHTGARVRLPALMEKPAPLQVSWLGYPNTTGLSAVDYRLTDADADPAGEGDRWYSEKLWRLPDGFLCYLPPHDAPEPAGPPLKRNGFVTFGSFNMLPKLSVTTVAAWAALLDKVPDSRLLLKCHPLGDAATRERVLRLFARFGIDGDRLTLLAVVPAKDHLELYCTVDVALDPFPYNGTTTTCEALWMGVPVVTLRGGRHAGRVGASLLRRLSLGELIAEDLGDYVEIAASLAADPERLSRYRGELRQRMSASALCDGKLFAASVEDAYRMMWRRWCRKMKRNNIEGEI